MCKMFEKTLLNLPCVTEGRVMVGENKNHEPQKGTWKLNPRNKKQSLLTNLLVARTEGFFYRREGAGDTALCCHVITKSIAHTAFQDTERRLWWGVCRLGRPLGSLQQKLDPCAWSKIPQMSYQEKISQAPPTILPSSLTPIFPTFGDIYDNDKIHS